MGAELLAFVAAVAVIVAAVCVLSTRSSLRRMARLESRLAESEHLRLELLRQNGELRQQLESAIKSLAVKPTRPPSPRFATSSVEPAPAEPTAPTPAPTRPPPTAGAALAPPPSWEDTQPFTTAPAPFSPTPANSLIPRLRR
jgi:hypothetical protein